MSTVADIPALYDDRGAPLGGGGLAFTDEQAVAVVQRDGPMLLSANAGSGKTAVLAERFVRSVVEDGHEPGQLLAITFTEKAAGELRARIRRRFMELGAREAARDMDGAWISTIHGFCARVLRAHAVTAGLDPAFVVLDEAIARQTRAEAYAEALAAFLAPAADGGELELVATWGVDRLHEAIAAVHDELRSTGHTTPALPPVPALPAPGETVARLRVAVRAADAERTTWRTGLKTLDAATLVLEELGTILGDDGPPTTGEAFAKRVAGLKLGRQAKELKTDALEELRAALAAVVQAEVDAEAVAVHARLDRLLGLYAAAYAKAKRARSAVDYDDLELLTNDLLGGAPAVAAAYQERFTRIMVDEFQDTNPLQLELLSHLDRGNVFLVGDALQSIYGFRHADVAVFRRRRREHQAIDAAPTLAANWRSEAPLLSAINAAFGALHDDYVPLVPGRGLEDDDEGEDRGPLVDLLLVDDAHDDEAVLPPERAAALQAGMPQARNLTVLAEARAVAADVAVRVAAGECTAGEVAVLLRAASDLHVFERALELEGLATLASGGRGYWLRQQVQDLTSYLAALANPRDEPALLALLASPLVGVSSDGLAAIAGAARAQQRTLWDAVAPGGEGLGLSADDRAAVSGFQPWFAAERTLAPLLPLDQLITRVVQRTRYDLHVLALAGGRRRLANIHKLERLAAAFEQGAGRDVRAFIDHVAAEVAAEAREPEAPVELGDLDAVQLMTIHAAKGLEFGVVVVAGLGRQGQSGVGDILVDGSSTPPRVGLRLVRLHAPNADALDYAALRARAQKAQVEEERRIMHVAFTRAERRLIISGSVKLGKDLPAERPGGIPLGWVTAAIDPTATHRLTAEEPELVVDRHVGTERLQVRARLVAAAAATGADPVGPAATGADPVGSAATGADPVGSAASGADPVVLEARTIGPRPDSPTRSAPDDGEQQLSLTVMAPTAALPKRGRIRAQAATTGSAPPPATLSYSSLTDHQDCGYRYYLRRVLGLPEAEPPPEPAPKPGTTQETPTPGLDPRIRGTIAHTLLEELMDPAGATADDVRQVADDAHAEVTDEEVDDLLQLVHAFGRTSVAARVARAVRARREEPFAFPLDDAHPGSPLVNGFIDLVAVMDDGGWLVVDYKTNQVADSDLEELVERTYAIQRRIYALAALRAGAPRVEVAYVFLQRPEEPVVSVHHADDLQGLAEELLDQAGPLLAGRFPVSDHPNRELCAYCPGRGGMCSWPEEMSLRPMPSAYS